MNAKIDVTGVVLETERLLLRGWKEEDLSDFYEYARVDGVGQMAGWLPHRSMEESERILERFMEGKKTFALVQKEEGKVIGSLGIEEYGERLSEFDSYRGREIGFVLSKDYWGRGYMTEAVQAVIAYLFDELQLDFLLCGHFDRNARSARVQEKCGFVPYRRLVFDTHAGVKEPGILSLLCNPKREITLERIHPETLIGG